MKIFFNFKLPKINKPYGGGLFFLQNLINHLKKEKDIQITFDLDKNINLIFIMDPRKNKYCHRKFGIDDIIQYKKQNPNVKIIHRVNECDIKRKISINIEPLLLKTMKHSDKIIFVSNWLENYYINKYNLDIDTYHILNGCNHQYFFLKNKKQIFNLNNNKKIKLVTHHWSNDYFKGFEIYNQLDKELDSRNDFELIYIGNYNKDYKPKNIKLVTPKCGMELGDLLRKCDVYITGTQYEPGGAHYLEGISCGLPILFYKNSGGAKEICSQFGEEFMDINDFFIKLNKIKNNYDDYINKDYSYLNSERCSKEYLKVIKNIISKKK